MPDIWLPGDEEVTVHIDTEGQVWVRNTVGMVRRPLERTYGFEPEPTWPDVTERP